MPKVEISPKVYKKPQRLREEVISLNIEDGDNRKDSEEFWDFDHLVEFMVDDVRDRSEEISKELRATKFQKANR